jgi:hypothetical protein
MGEKTNLAVAGGGPRGYATASLAADAGMQILAWPPGTTIELQTSACGWRINATTAARCPSGRRGKEWGLKSPGLLMLSTAENLCGGSPRPSSSLFRCAQGRNPSRWCSERTQKSGLRSLPRPFQAVVLIAAVVSISSPIWAQSTEAQAAPQGGVERTRKTFTTGSGTTSYSRFEESERRIAPEGQIETQRVRVPSWSGDRRVLLEREIRTKELPGGIIEKEYVLKNPDGADRLVPIEIIRERITKEGESATIEREVLKPDFAGHWRTTRRERATETGTEAAKSRVREVREPTLAGEWKVVEREVTSEKSAQDSKEVNSVRQLRDSYDRLADYEIRQERDAARPGQETREVILRRRDFQDTDHSQFYLVERTVSARDESGDGRVISQSKTESDLVAGGATRNVAASRSQLVEERLQEEVPGQGENRDTIVKVRERGVADPSMQPSYQVIQTTDRDGHVRQLFIPLR